MPGKRLIVVALTLLVAVLGLSSAAHATTPSVSLDCSSVNKQINCTANITGSGELEIIWEKGGATPELSRNRTTHSFRCFAGFFNLPYAVKVRVKGHGEATAFTSVRCDDVPFIRLLSAISCQPSLTALAGVRGGNYIICDILWSNDSPATVQWVSQNRQPVVTTNSDERWSRASFDCNNPGGPDLTFFASVRVTDAAGSMSTPATIPCGW
jgi:hypothetical protein